jgi:hypothetical protein
MLDNAKIRRYILARRAALRIRSYCLVGFFGCAIGAADCAWHVVSLLRRGEIAWASGLTIAAAAMAWLGWKLLSRANVYARQAADVEHDPPAGEPDFSSLGDGSQKVRDLEEMLHRGDAEDAENTS